MARPLRRGDYTVGWVCALLIELATAQEMLDNEHPDLEHDPADNDENLYALGSISLSHESDAQHVGGQLEQHVGRLANLSSMRADQPIRS